MHLRASDTPGAWARLRVWAPSSKGHAGGVKAGHRHMCTWGCWRWWRGSCTGSTGCASLGSGWSHSAVSWLRHGSHLWLQLAPCTGDQLGPLGQLLPGPSLGRGQVPACSACPCPGAHPDGCGGGPGHRCRAGGPAFRLPHLRLHLRHRLHPGFCVHDGESSRARDWVGAGAGSGAESLGEGEAGSLCI